MTLKSKKRPGLDPHSDPNSENQSLDVFVYLNEPKTIG